MAIGTRPFTSRSSHTAALRTVTLLTSAILVVSACNDLLSIDEPKSGPKASAGESGRRSDAADSGVDAQGGAGSAGEAGVGGSLGGAGESAGSGGAADAAGASAITGTLTRVSVATGNAEADSQSVSCSISSDGHYIAFASAADNLASDAWPYGTGVFIRDRLASTTVSATSAITSVAEGGGIQHPVLSADGSVLVFASTATLKADQSTLDTRIFRVRLRSEPPTAELIAQTAYQSASEPALNHDGTVVAYTLLRADESGHADIYVVGAKGTAELISANSSGAFAAGSSASAKLNASGDIVVFESQATDIVPSDKNDVSDIFLRERGAEPRTERISVALGGGDPNGYSSLPVVSSNGQRVAFASVANNLVATDTNGHTDIFVYDRATKTTRLVSTASDGTQANADSFYPALSANGRVVAFHSFASNLTPEAGPFIGDPGDTNVFVHDLDTGRTVRVSMPVSGTRANGSSQVPALSSNGRFVAFQSLASNFVDGDSNHSSDIFVWQFTAAPWL
jgi:Tol biopolymer transport system component